MTAALELTDWTTSFARRTKTLGGGEITAILSLAGATDVITFSGGFPDPQTFPADVLGEIAAGWSRTTPRSRCSTPRPRASRACVTTCPGGWRPRRDGARARAS